MASQQDPRLSEDVRAEDAGRAAADELRDTNKQRGVTGEVMVDDQQTQPDENRPGIIGSIIHTVTGTLSTAKDAVTGKTHDTTDKVTVVGGEAAEPERQNKQDATHKDYTARKDTTNDVETVVVCTELS
ncbi:hypothetical protein R6Q59_036580 [Mikania micrantha]